MPDGNTRRTPTITDRIGQAARDAFPRLNAARVGNNRAMAQAGSPAELAGAALVRSPATLAAGLVGDLVVPTARALTTESAFERQLADGIFGTSTAAPRSTAVRTLTPQPAAVGPQRQYTPQQLAERDSVTRALAQGREATESITPEDQLREYVNNVLRGPVTLEQATMAAGLIPAQAGAPSARDQAISAAASVAGIAADKELAQAAKIQDPEARYIAEQKATDKYLRGLYALGGADLPQLSLADIAGGE